MLHDMSVEMFFLLVKASDLSKMATFMLFYHELLPGRKW